MKWKIYYEGGYTFSDNDGDLKDAPARGVQVINQVDEHLNWITEANGDYYVWWREKELWKAVDYWGLIDYLIEEDLARFELDGFNTRYSIPVNNEWGTVDKTGFFLHLMGCGYVKGGRTINNKEFNEIFKRARNEFGEKGGFHKKERKPR